jgi:hypothetical protein
MRCVSLIFFGLCSTVSVRSVNAFRPFGSAPPRSVCDAVGEELPVVPPPQPPAHPPQPPQNLLDAPVLEA